ncbi:hypothetical protein Vadar_012449 [Vaccinium darrowii]|uniref:Uncharacterized protein n=1 Tax=Vaccinium darrowii TaxID=229202 RepID=A0ACB7YL46_9ERIC|nr:hypothetical protein Vadar_012449 [Vaccinium darrowii]
MASSHRDWASLPLDLIYSIREKLVQFSDYVRFIAVCQQWRHSLEQDTGDYKQRLHILKTCRNKLPMLMIDTKENHKPEANHELDKRCLFSVTDGNISRVRLPLPCNKRFLGSSFGWLFITEEKPMVITLFNPFSRVVISLPPLKDPDGHYEHYIDNPQNFITKAVLLSDPFLHPNNYEVVVIYNDMCQLAMFKSGQNSWNFFHSDRPLLFSDVIYYGKGQSEGLYAVSYWDELVKIDFASGTEKVLTKKSAAVNAQVTYLVQSQDGDLLLVQRFWTEPFKYGDNPDEEIIDKTFRFAIFKLLHPTGETGATWVQIKSLGDQALFLGDNHSLSVSTLEFPECLPDCIYYTEQYHVEFGSRYVFHGNDEDSGIYHLEEGSFRSHYISDPLGKDVLPPIWFVPNMKGT